jgi:hypothetical protein
VELELDGHPRNRPLSSEDSPHATRWRVGEQDIVAVLDVATGIVTVRVRERVVGELSARGGSVRFMLAPSSGYRGGDQVEARMHRDARTDALTLWVDSIEVTPVARPAPGPIPPRAAPSTPLVQKPRAPFEIGSRLNVVLWAFCLVAITASVFIAVRPKKQPSTVDLERRTAACLARADVDAADAKAKLGSDPAARMRDEDTIDDRRRLARIACKQHETDCKRAPRGLPCMLDAK